MVWAPSRSWWWLALLFGAGSLCFFLGPFPSFLQWVGPQTDAAVFFAGSILFTSAAALQWVGTVTSDADQAGRRFRLHAWQPRRVDWWSSGVQLVGTLAFNVTTFRALTTAIDSPSYDRLVWRPDAVGSVCFLVSGWLAYGTLSGGPLRRPPRGLDGGIAAVNLLGCVFFGVAALGSYVVPATDAEAHAIVANAGTAAGALAFLVGAVLLVPQGARAPVRPAA